MIMEYLTFFSMVWLVLLIPGFDNSVPPTGDKTFKIEYSENVQSIKTTSDKTFDFWGLDIELKQNSDDILDVKIPKNFPTPASFTDTWHYDERGIVMGDKVEIAYEMVKDPCYFHYKIPVEGKKKVEIVYGVILTGEWKLYSPRQFDENDPCYNKVFYEQLIPSPLKQFKSGISAIDIQCKEILQLVFKTRDGSPACVKPSSILRLVTQGWIIPSNFGSPVIAQSAVDVAMKDERVQHLIFGNDTHVRAVQQGVSFKDDCPFFSCSAVLIDKVDANETLVVIVSTATQKVIDIKTTPGWNQTTIQPKESTRLIPSNSLLLPQEEFAHLLVNATSDKIIKKRIDDDQRVVYTTDKGNLIIAKSTQPFTGLVDYFMTGANKNLVFVKDVGFRMNKTEALDSVRSFMKNIDFKLDGTEQVDVVDFVNRIQITIQQTNSGWIVQNQRMEFSFWQDHTTISLGKWYTNVASVELRYSQDQAKQIAYEYLKSEMQTNSTLKELGVVSYPNYVQMEIIDDSLVYVVSGEGFKGVEVIVNPYSGAIQSWRFAMRIF